MSSKVELWSNSLFVDKNLNKANSDSTFVSKRLFEFESFKLLLPLVALETKSTSQTDHIKTNNKLARTYWTSATAER